MQRKIGLLFDYLRAPYDAAHIIQVATALGNCDIYLSGNSINLNHHKIVSKVKSWGIEHIPEITKFDSLEEAVGILHAENKYLIGTSPYADEDLYDVNFPSKDSVLVFGTESSGLTKRKISLLDRIIKIPMSHNCQFLTLTTAVPIVAYEIYRQMREVER